MSQRVGRNRVASVKISLSWGCMLISLLRIIGSIYVLLRLWIRWIILWTIRYSVVGRWVYMPSSVCNATCLIWYSLIILLFVIIIPLIEGWRYPGPRCDWPLWYFIQIFFTYALIELMKTVFPRIIRMRRVVGTWGLRIFEWVIWKVVGDVFCWRSVWLLEFLVVLIIGKT